MIKIPKRFLDTVGGAVMICALAALTLVVFGGDKRPSPALLFDYQSSISTTVRVLFDVGTGFEEKYSTRQFVRKQSMWREIRLNLRKVPIRKLRLDPADNAGRFKIRNLRVVAADGKVRLVIHPAKIRPTNQILSMIERNGELDIQTVAGANDPMLEIPLESAIDLSQGRVWRIVSRLAGWMLFWTVVVAGLYYAPRLLPRNAIFLALCRKPTVIIWLAALAGTLASTSPVVFLGKSLMSPNTGALLFYDHYPTLPNYSDSATEDVHVADVGAMAWQHFPLTVAQERAIKEFGEFPLWNRYNSAGTTMIGQGQMMLGDPLNWMMWLVGVDAATFDIKFLLLRIVFAGSLGMAVWVITRAILPSALVAIASPFIGYFIFRVNHPAIFTLCYAPLILLAWLKVIYAEDDRFRLRWVMGLLLANWLVLNSGTAKEAYMSIISLNALGFSNFALERIRFGGRFSWWLALLAVTGVCFVMIASPVWGTLYDAIRDGVSNYHVAQVNQFPIFESVGFVDNLYYLYRLGFYSPALNVFLFSGFVFGIMSAIRGDANKSKLAAIVLTCGCAMLFALSFKIIPESLLKTIPLIKNVVTTHLTFSTILIVPASVLAGIGFAYLDENPNKKIWPMILLIVLLFLYLFSFANWKGGKVGQVILYSHGLLISAALLPWLLVRLCRGELGRGGVGLCAFLTLIALGRGAMFTKTNVDYYVLNPQRRVSLTVHPDLIKRLAGRITAEPRRVLGLRDVLVAGYNATLGLEHINGPDAIWNRQYRELSEALKMPFNDWAWRMVFDEKLLATKKNSLDMLGVGVVLTSDKIGENADLSFLDEDEEIYAYARDSVWPRAFFTDRIETYDDLPMLVQRISNGDALPFVAINHNDAQADFLLRTHTQSITHARLIVRARDYHLTNNSTAFTIDVPNPGVVYLGETDEPGDFEVTVNGERASYLTANHAFKAIVVHKPGTFRVVFRYWPARLTWYLVLSGLGLAMWLTALAFFWKLIRRWSTFPAPTIVNQ